MDIFHEIFDFALGVLRFYIASMDCLRIAPRTHVVMAIKGLTFHPVFSYNLDEGCIFVEFLFYCGVKKICHGNK